ncbi:MAG: HAMP domain-containing histidine kinase [Candidatus Bathyarchaeota archaeon]|nr:HAMP domain-containing histidine kinase [Candidatus Bathyarchaeota archaeon]
MNGSDRDDSNRSLDRVLAGVDSLLRSSGVLDASTASEANYGDLLEGIGAKIDEELRRSREDALFVEIGAISSGLAHDLRGPLQTIRNCTYLLVSEPNQGELLDEINGAVRHISLMLDRFREYYRGHEIRRTTVGIDKIVDAALRDVVIPSGVDLVKTLDPGLDRVYVDPNKLVNVIRNLVNSAINVMHDGGRLSVSTALRGERFTITVSDTGSGFPEATPETLFTPFDYRARDGTGLSLPIARRVVKAHGGNISIVTDPDKGTACTLEMPLGP